MSQGAWVFGGILLLLLFITATVVMGIILAVDNGIFCGSPEKDTISSTSGNMNVFVDTSLYPYNGNWNDKQIGKTVSECVEICLNDASCKGFHRHNENGLPIDEGTCYLYNGNNVQAMLGDNVNVSPYFTKDKLIVGAQQPLNSTDVYLKTNTAYSIFRSSYDSPKIAKI
jgi:hypothetical protein